MHHWQLQDAKARLSELLRRAEREGPQEITVHGKPKAVVLSKAAYDRLVGRNASLVDFMRRSPLYGADDLTFEREQDLTREIEL